MPKRLHLEPLEQRYLLTNSLVVVPSPAIDRSGLLLGAAALAPNDIWAVGFKNPPRHNPQDPYEQTLAEHFDGNSWQVVPTPSLGLGSRLSSVAAVASNDVWAVGDRTGPPFGHPLIEHWDGSSWTIIDGPTSSTALYGVTAISSNDVWTVGRIDNNNALVDHWDGSSWSVVSSSAFTGVGSLRSVSADAGNDVWACEGDPYPGQAVLHFDATSWTRINPQTQIYLSSITALSPSDVWAVGTVFEAFDPETGEPTDSRPAIEHWDGSQWQEVPSPDPRPGGQGLSRLSGVAAISPTDIWAVGTPGSRNTLTEHWDGTSWSIIPSPNPTPNQNGVFAVTARSDGTVAALGSQADGTLILQNPESAPPGSGPAVPAAPLFVHASAGPRWLLAGPGTVSNVAMRDTSLLQDQLNPRSVDPVFAAGKAESELSLARDRSLAPQGPEDHLGRTDAIDRLFTEWFVVPALAG
jgi:hypothetical protein